MEPHRTPPAARCWAAERRVDGGGLTAIVVGCALGADAEYLANLGFNTNGFDVAPTAIDLARRRHPDTRVRYLTADILDPPTEWRHAFDLVVEIITVQALPPSHQPRAIANIGRLVAAGGTLLVISAIDGGQPRKRLSEPDPLNRAGIASFAADGLVERRFEDRAVPGQAEQRRWLAEFTRLAREPAPPSDRACTPDAPTSSRPPNPEARPGGLT
jgi:SAM-dependent methyltransferase